VCEGVEEGGSGGGGGGEGEGEGDVHELPQQVVESAEMSRDGWVIHVVAFLKYSYCRIAIHIVALSLRWGGRAGTCRRANSRFFPTRTRTRA